MDGPSSHTSNLERDETSIELITRLSSFTLLANPKIVVCDEIDVNLVVIETWNEQASEVTMDDLLLMVFFIIINCKRFLR